MAIWVVYESLWGNTAAIARAIAEGLGEEAIAVSTADTDPAEAASIRALIAGAPVHGMSLPTSESLAAAAAKKVDEAHLAPRTDAPLMRDWLAGLPELAIPATAFDTRVRGPLGRGSSTAIIRAQAAKGCSLLAQPKSFRVDFRNAGPTEADLLKDGELAKARAWGAQLATVLNAAAA
ncbi:flavodoxin family protein [Demequina salsinemoris]|uniref:flavodoxin family protein n=1 Tax=Demequina salsinemoris TaxID=577470 RepID=UPI0007842D39|nr:flavodoxin domain-containing protein [Demequina salsinemoris]